MGKPRSRVEQEALEAKKQAVEIQKQIDQLSAKLSNPEKYFTKKADPRTASTVERFYRYFGAASAAATEKRKPTRAEMRAARNQTVLLWLIAIILLFWAFGKSCGGR